MRLPVASYAQPSRNAQRLVNCYAQPSTGKVPVEIVGTPGAVLYRALGGTGRGLAVQQGTLYAVAGNTLYDVPAGAAVGTIPGGATLQFAAGVTQLVTDNGYILSSGAVSRISDVDKVPWSSVDFVDGYVVAVEKNTGRFISSALNDSSSYDGLDFATAEGAPDNLRSLVVSNRDVHLLGVDTCEEWWNSGASGFTFERKAGGFREIGIAGRLARVKADNTVFMIANDRTARVLRGSTWVKYSQIGVEEAFSSYPTLADCEMVSYLWNGSLFVQHHFPSVNKTWVYNGTTSEWFEQDYRYVAAVDHDGKVWVQGEDGTVGYLSDSAHTVFGDAVTREVTTNHTFNGNARVFISQLDAIFRTGDVDPGLIPMCQLDMSYDGGNERVSLPPRELGRMGGYRQVIRWTRLGMARDIVVRLRVSDAVPFVLQGIELEAQGGAK